ncbi:helix-turn-helix domain-containing protein [Labilibaculum sp. A4]|uniref:helix-turn-helix domain-containing protein n=1 Tax=Labilibaculum euxinus TaxID=2686357 RepID=UPI000F61940A|nr:helix-turn-helix domain-containing protein [Labilibaculum euxinus]MDQ1771196.1 helix-turn-helix domain-containing protein [Labilibaculum euxinus]MWN76797.1 helix-turn-helix domain-containing protein [Labilibaculum euxinus]
MSKLKSIREQQNLTQEELSKKSGISVRTIQRIEAGTDPKGYTLRVLGEALGVQEKELRSKQPEIENKEDSNEKTSPKAEDNLLNYSSIKLINLSSLPFIILPPLNILIPLILMFAMKLKNPITKQIISLQIMWTIIAPIVFMLGIFTKSGHNFTLILMILLILSNVYFVLRNAIEIDKRKKLYYSLHFNMI